MYRLPAFTSKEVKLLDDLIEKNNSIINTTRGDFEMFAKNKEYWLEIEKKCNAFTVVPRSIRMLKEKYGNLKRKRGLIPKHKRTTSKGLGKESNNFGDNNTKAPVRIETLTSVQSSSSNFSDDSKDDSTMLSPLELVKEEIIHQSSPVIKEESIRDIKPIIDASIIPTDKQPPSTSTEPITEGDEEKIKLMINKHHMEIELMKKETDAKLNRIYKEAVFLKNKMEEHRMKQDIPEWRRERIIEY
ncbi:hypothetical protein GWI33_002473 [Rhynchophorus ferrugineus]|uniref:Regulatory protein zeste n=1 Tax=Rhynchophorus ferrugineus TaxID=354439 RepID=A0A834IX69_RHYFE|nr:hypothetical protein GWI33_002473 [Rhynchophorus ferrugineus]